MAHTPETLRESPVLQNLRAIAETPSTALDAGTKEFLRERGCLDDAGELLYKVEQANGVVYLVDSLHPPKENAVYPFQEEGTDLLRTAQLDGQTFEYAVDAFAGGGHSLLPLVKNGVAKKGIGGEVNPRAIHLSRVNAELNGLQDAVRFDERDVTKEVPRTDGTTLYVANPPFALQVKGVTIDRMRDGGHNGLRLAEEFLKNAAAVAKPGDCIVGVVYSRMGAGDEVEVRDVLEKTVGARGQVTRLELVEGAVLNREHDGVKRSRNPMPIGNLELRAHPDNAPERAKYREAAEGHEADGYPRLGYFRYVVRMHPQKERIQDGTQAEVEQVLSA